MYNDAHAGYKSVRLMLPTYDSDIAHDDYFLYQLWDNNWIAYARICDSHIVSGTTGGGGVDPGYPRVGGLSIY